MTWAGRSPWLFALVLVLQACTSREDIAERAAIPPYPEPYRAALQQEFRLLADREAAQNDHRDAKRFLARAEQAARLVTIHPLPVDAYDVSPVEQDDLEAARARLATLFDGGRARAPQALARAHAAYECWLEEAEEGHQPDDIAWCRDRFETAVAATRRDSGLDADWGLVLTGDDGHVGAISISGEDGGERLLDRANAAGFVHETGNARDARMTNRETVKFTSPTLSMLPPPAAVYIVFFATGSAALDDAAKGVIADAAADAADRVAVDVELLGFADRSGEDRRNLALSERRVEAVRAVMANAGVPEDAFLNYARGEDNPPIATADGVAEPRNRRVEITVR